MTVLLFLLLLIPSCGAPFGRRPYRELATARMTLKSYEQIDKHSMRPCILHHRNFRYQVYTEPFDEVIVIDALIARCIGLIHDAGSPVTSYQRRLTR